MLLIIKPRLVNLASYDKMHCRIPAYWLHRGAKTTPKGFSEKYIASTIVSLDYKATS